MPYQYGHSIKLGFAPTRREMNSSKAFNVDEANKYKKIVEDWLKKQDVDYVNLDFLNKEGLLYNKFDADIAAKQFINEDVDALFVPHCNFGAEDAMARLAKKLNKPVLVWGPQDDPPAADGSRLRDSQCGIFATTKVLSRNGVTFSYVTNCPTGDAVLDRGFHNFMAAASVVKSFKNLRIGMIGVRPSSFWSVIHNEGELLERFGIEIVPITLPELRKMYDHVTATRKDEIASMAAEVCQSIKKIDFDAKYLETASALRLTIDDWAREQKLSAAASACWGPMFETIGISPCFAFSELTGAGLPVICEADVHGAVTAVMAHAAVRWQSPVFLADVTNRHPTEPNAELFWHCGVFPRMLMREGCEAELSTHYNRKSPIVGHWELKHEDVTITRFDGINGNYSLLMGHGRGVDGPGTHGTYLWVQFGDWPKWERKFVYGPYIHHCVGVYGHVAPALYEACRYIDVKPDPVEPGTDELEKILRS